MFYFPVPITQFTQILLFYRIFSLFQLPNSRRFSCFTPYFPCSINSLRFSCFTKYFHCSRSLNSERVCVHRNLCIAILAAQLTFISGIDAVEQPVRSDGEILAVQKLGSVLVFVSFCREYYCGGGVVRKTSYKKCLTLL